MIGAGMKQRSQGNHGRSCDGCVSSWMGESTGGWVGALGGGALQSDWPRH